MGTLLPVGLAQRPRQRPPPSPRAQLLQAAVIEVEKQVLARAEFIAGSQLQALRKQARRRGD